MGRTTIERDTVNYPDFGLILGKEADTDHEDLADNK
jgi:hypothetical protein